MQNVLSLRATAGLVLKSVTPRSGKIGDTDRPPYVVQNVVPVKSSQSATLAAGPMPEASGFCPGPVESLRPLARQAIH